MENRHVEVFGRLHMCAVCEKAATVGLDVKVGYAGHICGYAEDGMRRYPFADVEVKFGCTDRCALGSSFLKTTHPK